MDPHTNVTEIWPFFMNRGNGATSDCEYETRLTHFGQGSGHFVGNPISDASGDESRGWVRQSGGKKGYEAVSGDVPAKVVSTSATSVMNDWDGKRNKLLRSSSHKETKEVEIGGASGHAAAENSAKLAEPPKQDYIHVRARRGQATDSHSLAERVIGKALVLDEITNYIHSLQHQVEFLSMKLEAINYRLPTGLEVFSSKVFGQQAFDSAGMGYPLQPPIP